MLLQDKLKVTLEENTLDVNDIAFLTGRAGEKISPPYWYALVKGTKDNPSRKRIGALATLFEVPWRYLADDEVDTPVEAVCAEAAYLSAEDLQQVIVRLQKQLEQAADEA